MDTTKAEIYNLMGKDSEEEKSFKPKREWSNKFQFVLSLIGYSVGLGNIWRFPYLCMRNGGGAFLIPYVTCVLLCGMPLYVMEVCAGQFSGFGPLEIWNICPLFTGLGYCMLVLITIFSVYYNVIMAWIIYYFFKSCNKVLPWSTCDNDWNTLTCWIHQHKFSTDNTSFFDRNIDAEKYDTISNSPMVHQDNVSDFLQTNSDPGNNTFIWSSPAEEFWHNKVLQLSSGIDTLDGLRWDLVGCLVLSWVIVFLCICRGARSIGKVVYVTAIMPYVLLTALLVRGMFLEGSLEGVKYYIIPDWNKLLEFRVWAEASLQVFFSFGPAWGSLFVMASYNKFDNNCIRDSVLVTLVGSFTSFFAGFVIFSVIGFMAHKTGLSFDAISTSGPGLVFIAYPEAISRMPASPVWAILFFVMLVFAGLDTQMVCVETVVQSFVTLCPRYFANRNMLLSASVSLIFLICALPMCTRAGLYILLLCDWYVGAFSVIICGILECIIIFWIYGQGRFFYDLELMFGQKPWIWWRICWGYITPTMLSAMVVYNLFALGQPYYRDYTYPAWAVGIGWVIAVSSFIPVPLFMVKWIVQAEGNFVERLKSGLKPTALWQPSEPDLKSSYRKRYQEEEKQEKLLPLLMSEKASTQNQVSCV